MIELTEEVLRKLASEIYSLYQEEIKKLPYGANVIDELHAGENAHSRILRLLLQYEGGGTYPIYSSFLKLISKHCDDKTNFIIHSPQFTNEEGRVDVLIKELYSPNPYAIIVENKVCEAGDQENQIERYIDFVKTNIPENSIYAIYLTSDGSKKISDFSLTAKAKASLGVKEKSNGRFITLDYKNHILPWLIDDVLPNIKVKEDLLISSVKLYIDYLNGMFGFRQNEQPITNKIHEIIKNRLHMENLQDSIKLYKEVESLMDKSRSELLNSISTLLEDKFYKPFKEAFSSLDLKIDGFDETHFSFYINVKKWNKCFIKLTWDSKGQYFGIAQLDLNNKVSQETRDALKVFTNNHPTEWWPLVQYLKDSFKTANSFDIWDEVDSGRVFDFFKEWLTKVLKTTDNLDI